MVLPSKFDDTIMKTSLIFWRELLVFINTIQTHYPILQLRFSIFFRKVKKPMAELFIQLKIKNNQIHQKMLKHSHYTLDHIIFI